MTTVTYDRDLSVYSSLVEDAYYNSQTSDLFLEMGDCVYRYADVPESVADGLENASSAGRYYNAYIKGQFESENLGYWGALNYVDLTEEDEDEEDEWGDEDETEDEESEVDETPVLTANEVRTNVFSLSPVTEDATVPVGRKYRHTVKFDVLGTERVYSTEAGANVNESVEALTQIADMLGLEFTVKEVVVSFG